MGNSALTMDSAFLRDLSVIAEDEGLTQKLIKYVHRLVQKQPDPTLMTKEEFFANVDAAREEIRQGKGKSFDNLDDMNAWLNSL